MHLFEFAFYTAGTLYALFTEQILIFYFLIVVGAYLAVASFLPGAKEISIRKKIMLGTWTPPSEGVALLKFPVRVDKTLKLIESLPKENRLTLTHFVIKAIGELLHECPDINGKLVFGKVFIILNLSSSNTKLKMFVVWLILMEVKTWLLFWLKTFTTKELMILLNSSNQKEAILRKKKVIKITKIELELLNSCQPSLFPF